MNIDVFKNEISNAFKKINDFREIIKDVEKLKIIIDGSIKYPIELVSIIVSNYIDSLKIYNGLIQEIIDKLYLSKISIDELNKIKDWKFSNIN